jgi:L,D-peptidoglycan transpeptidase YkuD (ErfK/YbiS/YcfS/YnhG family)
VKATELAETVREALDPQGRGRQYLARRLQALIGTRAGGFTLEATREGSPAKPVLAYRLRSSEGGGP